MLWKFSRSRLLMSHFVKFFVTYIIVVEFVAADGAVGAGGWVVGVNIAGLLFFAADKSN